MILAIIFGIIILVIIISSSKKRKREEAEWQARYIRERDAAERLARINWEAAEKRREEDRIRRLEELNNETIIVVYENVDENNEPQVIVKRSNNTYAFVERPNDQFKISAEVRIAKVEANTWNWYDETTYQREFAKRQQEDLERQERLEAERQTMLEVERQAMLILQMQEDERQARAEELKPLLTRKQNWQEFQHVLQQNNVMTLYHFTDRANIASIIRYGGLYSWYYCSKNDIIIPYPGGDGVSRREDMLYDLQDYVRLSFCNDHPMKYVARNQGRIQNPVILTISLDVCYFQETRFADMNATRRGHRQGKNLENLQSVHFNTVRQRSHFDLEEAEKPYFQAEVLVKTWIPLEYITNINSFCYGKIDQQQGQAKVETQKPLTDNEIICQCETLTKAWGVTKDLLAFKAKNSTVQFLEMCNIILAGDNQPVKDAVVALRARIKAATMSGRWLEAYTGLASIGMDTSAIARIIAHTYISTISKSAEIKTPEEVITKIYKPYLMNVRRQASSITMDVVDDLIKLEVITSDGDAGVSAYELIEAMISLSDFSKLSPTNTFVTSYLHRAKNEERVVDIQQVTSLLAQFGEDIGAKAAILAQFGIDVTDFKLSELPAGIIRDISQLSISQQIRASFKLVVTILPISKVIAKSENKIRAVEGRTFLGESDSITDFKKRDATKIERTAENGYGTTGVYYCQIDAKLGTLLNDTTNRRIIFEGSPIFEDCNAAIMAHNSDLSTYPIFETTGYYSDKEGFIFWNPENKDVDVKGRLLVFGQRETRCPNTNLLIVKEFGETETQAIARTESDKDKRRKALTLTPSQVHITQALNDRQQANPQPPDDTVANPTIKDPKNRVKNLPKNDALDNKVKEIATGAQEASTNRRTLFSRK